MNRLKIIAMALLIIMMIAGMAVARQLSDPDQDQAGPASPAAPSLSDYEKNSLLLMRQEEKLARDVYLTLGEKYNLPVFTNIPQAEQRHMDQLGQLLEKYGMDDPVAGLARGKFNSGEMQSLYNKLVAQGSKSLVAALQAGATIEDLDIHDLEQALAGGVDNRDMVRVYRNLAKGSRNHMRAFTSQLKAHDAVYKAQYISQADLEAIMNSDWERGPADGQGHGRQGRGGKGRGQGRGQGGGHGQGGAPVDSGQSADSDKP